MPKRLKNTVLERNGVNYVRAVVEAANCPFKEINREHDYGHDAFIHCVDGERVTPIEFAVQIKAGITYVKGNACIIPATRDLLSFWSRHVLTTYGIVYDPAEKTAHWIDLKSASKHELEQNKNKLFRIKFEKAIWNKFDQEDFKNIFLPTIIGSMPKVSIERALLWAKSEDYIAHEMGCKWLFRIFTNEAASWELFFNQLQNRDLDSLSFFPVYALCYALWHPDIFYDAKINQDIRDCVRVWVSKLNRRDFERLLSFYDSDNGFERGGPGNLLLSIMSQIHIEEEWLDSPTEEHASNEAISDALNSIRLVREEDPDFFAQWGISFRKKS